MKIEIIETKKKTARPKVGEVWRHGDASAVYMRIPDSQGAAALNHGGDHKDERFYSIDLRCGIITWTPDGGYDDCVILEQVEPLKLKPLS